MGRVLLGLLALFAVMWALGIGSGPKAEDCEAAGGTYAVRDGVAYCVVDGTVVEMGG